MARADERALQLERMMLAFAYIQAMKILGFEFEGDALSKSRLLPLIVETGMRLRPTSERDAMVVAADASAEFLQLFAH